MTARSTGAVWDTITNVSPARSFGLIALSAARRWSLGKITTKAPLQEGGTPGLAALVPFEEKQHRFFLSKGLPQVAGNIDSISSRQCSAVRRAGSARLRASRSIRVRSESPSRSKAWRDERLGVQLRLPHQPAIEPRARDRERLDPPVSARRHELCAS